MLTATLLLSAVTVPLQGSEGVAPTVSTIAGTGSHGTLDGETAQFNLPRGVLASSRGVYVADTFNNLIRRVNTDGNTSTIAGNILGMDVLRFPVGAHRDAGLNEALFNRPADIMLGANGSLFVLDSANHALRLITQNNVFTFAGTGQAGHNDGPVFTAQFNKPYAMATGPDGEIFIADSGNHTIRRIDTYGVVSTVAGRPGMSGYNDGATMDALFNGPMGIAVDSQGRIFVADTGNHLIRMIYNGNVTTLAGRLVFPSQVDFDITYFDDEWDDAPLGGFANGHGAEAMFNLPQGLAMWNDTLIVADTGNHRIRAIMPGGAVITIAGDGLPGHQDGQITGATFHLPENVSVLGNTLYIADTGNNVIRTINLINTLLRDE